MLSRNRRTLRAPAQLRFVVGFAVLLAGCSSTPRSKIDGADGSVLFGAGRFSLDLTTPKADAPVSEPSPIRTSLEAQVHYSSGEFQQDLRAGERIQVSTLAFTGPDTVSVFTDLLSVDVAVRFERRWPDNFGVAGRLGVRFTDLDITLRSGPFVLPKTSDANIASYGLLVGVEGFYEPVDWLQLYAGASMSSGLGILAFAQGYDDTKLRGIELGSAWSVAKGARFTAGWRQVEYSVDSLDSFRSDIDFKHAGPFVGFWASF